jgi:tetratricopeptide (TPR) repeat protein
MEKTALRKSSRLKARSEAANGPDKEASQFSKDSSKNDLESLMEESVALCLDGMDLDNEDSQTGLMRVLMDSAARLIRLGEDIEAEKVLALAQRFSKNDEFSFQLMVSRGKCHLRAKDWEGAQVIFEELQSLLETEGSDITEHRVWMESFHLLGKTYLKLKKTNEARILYEKILLESPKSVEALLGLTETALQEKNFEKSFFYIEKAFEIKPSLRPVALAFRSSLESGDFSRVKRFFKEKFGVQLDHRYLKNLKGQ